MKIRISSVEGNRQWLDGGSMFGNAPRAVWQNWLKPDDLGRIPLACRCLLIETDKNKKYLLETGIGCFFSPKLAERYGVEGADRHSLIDNLAKLEVSPDQIDVIILSHLHFDHAGGLLGHYDEGRQIVFRNAIIVTGETAWERAHNPHPRDRASFVPEVIQTLDGVEDRVVLVKDGDRPSELPDCFRFFESHGHTPGQLHTVVSGSKESVVFCGDLVPGTQWMHIPITMGYDRFAEKVIDEKTRLYSEAIPEDRILFFTHDPNFSAAKAKYDEKERVIPKQTWENFTRFEL